jgi:hypothetical protein
MGISQIIKYKAHPVVPVEGPPIIVNAPFYVPNRVLHKDLNKNRGFTIYSNWLEFNLPKYILSQSIVCFL